jgi:hypothetical protein
MFRLKMKKYLLIITFCVFIPEMVIAQGCCCAGGGGLGTSIARFGLGTADARILQILTGYDLNYMNRLYDGDIRVKENVNPRVIHSSILVTDFGISRKLSVAAIMSYMFQELGSTTLDGRRQVDYLWGLGDMIFMAKVRLMNPLAYNGWGIYTGMGIKIPTGNSSHSNPDGFTFPMDIQPGSGSFDAIYWLSFSKTHILISNLNLNSGATFRLSGRNRNYQDSLTYSPGNEVQYSAGISYSFYKKFIFDIFNYANYRYQAIDKLSGEPVDKTGGHWLYTSPGIRLNFTPNFSCLFSADLPLYCNLNGPQLATSCRFSVAATFNITTRHVNEIGFDQ